MAAFFSDTLFIQQEAATNKGNKMFRVTDANGQSIYYTNERDAERNRKPGETITRVPRKSRGYLHNDND